LISLAEKGGHPEELPPRDQGPPPNQPDEYGQPTPVDDSPQDSQNYDNQGYATESPAHTSSDVHYGAEVRLFHCLKIELSRAFLVLWW
jgi:hypothetical protein